MTVPGLRRHSAETLLRNADTAMYRAKEGGRGRWELFDDEMRAQVRERFEIERGLPVAMATGALSLLYQAVVDPLTEDVVAAEALLRWDRPGHGRVLPENFLPVAEDSGLIEPDRHVGAGAGHGGSRAVAGARTSFPAPSVCG